MVEVGRPSVRRIRPVETRARAEFRQHRRVERIRRHRDEHFALVVDERAQRQLDRFRRAGGDETRSAVTGNPRREYSAATASRAGAMPGRRTVTVVAVAHGADDRLHHVRRRLEPERRGIADVEVADACARGLDLLGLDDNVADGVGKACRLGRQPARSVCARRFEGCHAAIYRDATPGQ